MRLAERERRRGAEGALLHQRQRGQALARAAARLRDGEHGAAEHALLGLALLVGGGRDLERAVERVDLSARRDLLGAGQKHERARR